MPPSCPRCRLPLRAEAGVDLCDQCGGVWFDRGELEAAIEAAPPQGAVPAARPEPAVRYLPCPRCTTLMNRKAYERISGVTLDHCNAHGVWLDAGELDRILAFEAGDGRERLAIKLTDEARLDRERQRDASQRWARIRAGLESY
ncbi:hypothetical protein LBMAG42_07770 [Deltaproteobacteria bacterium]|nr:hypothetical protein LBMAG42_07770 [Deltaproteobacteria bacterium]